MSETRRTRTGYRYGVVSADEIVRRAGDHLVMYCDEGHCWTLIQGGPGAMDDHRRTVHRGDGPPRISIGP